jgi:phosphoribosylglycinamide formyltransferase-1
MKRLGILLSGRGSNFRAIAEAIQRHSLVGAEIAVVLSNIADAPGLALARDLGLKALAIPSAERKRADHDAEMIAQLREHDVDLVCLVQAFPNRIVNVHPSLLPAFPGLDAQQQALAYGARIAGCTVHFVDEAVDHGAIILQRAVEVQESDTPGSLAARILDQEHIAYPEAIARVLSGEYEVRGRRYLRRT